MLVMEKEKELACGNCDEPLLDCDACEDPFKKDEPVACLVDGWFCAHHLHMDYCYGSLLPEFKVNVIEREKEE